MSELTSFTNDMFGEIRTIVIDGEPWFVGKDIAKALGYSNTKEAISVHIRKEDRKLIQRSENATFDIPNRGLTIINESGLYSLIILSKLPKAKDFNHWVTSEVLPQIRKTGGYIPVNKDDDDLTIMSKAHIILERTLEHKNKIISELQPKADVYDMVMDSNSTFDMNTAAKMIGIGEYILFSYLRNKKVLFRNSDNCNVPFERFRKNGCFKVVDSVCPDGKARSVTRVTQKGIDYICKLIQKDKETDKEIS